MHCKSDYDYNSDFLAGKEGSVFIGVTDNGYVQGVKCNRDDRDGMRIGVDHMMTDRIVPALLHNQYKVLFHPVTKRETIIGYVAGTYRSRLRGGPVATWGRVI